MFDGATGAVLHELNDPTPEPGGQFGWSMGTTRANLSSDEDDGQDRDGRDGAGPPSNRGGDRDHGDLPPVRRIIHMRTQHLGPDELLVGAKLELDRSLGFDGVAAAIDRIEEAVRVSVPEARVLYIEPDVEREV